MMNVNNNTQSTTFNYQTSSFVDDKDKRSTFNTQPVYEEGYDVYSQNGVSRDQLLSPIPHTMQSVEYQNFGTFSQQKQAINEQDQQPVRRELDMMQSQIDGNGDMNDNARSKTEYSYQDIDNVPVHNKSHKQNTKRRHNRNNRHSNKHRDSTSSESDRSNSDGSSSRERSHKHDRNSQKKYKKLKKVL